jgi:hypothetical protein
MSPEQQTAAQKMLGGGPAAAWITTVLADWNIVLETVTLVLGIISGIVYLYFLVRDKRKKSKSEK